METQPDKVLDAPGTACATLTPMIKNAIMAINPGELLEVKSDDPAAREGVPAWCRLTGNPLIIIKEIDSQNTIFHIRKKK